MPRTRPLPGVAVVAVLLWLALPAPAAAGDPSFGSFVKRLEKEYQLRRTHIPVFWLAKAVVRVAKPAGVSRLDLALFEDKDLSPLARAADLQARVNSFLGEGWKPFVEVHAPRRGERVLLYMRQSGRDVELFIFTVEDSEAVALLTRVNPEALCSLIENPDTFWRRHSQ